MLLAGPQTHFSKHITSNSSHGNVLPKSPKYAASDGSVFSSHAKYITDRIGPILAIYVHSGSPEPPGDKRELR